MWGPRASSLCSSAATAFIEGLKSARSGAVLPERLNHFAFKIRIAVSETLSSFESSAQPVPICFTSAAFGYYPAESESLSSDESRETSVRENNGGLSAPVGAHGEIFGGA